MLETIAPKAWYSHNGNRPLQGSGPRNRNVRSVFMSSVAAILLVGLSSHSNAENTQGASSELGKSGQLKTDGQNETTDLKSTKPKIKCIPKKPCPDIDKPE